MGQHVLPGWLVAAVSRPRVGVDKGQYFVGGGGDPEQPDLSVLPGLLIGTGPSSFAVLSGLGTGLVPVELQPLSESPASVAEGWDAIGELTIDCLDGSIRVAGWSLPADDESTELAASGPGLYRVRIHVRDRTAVNEDESEERHLLQAWPVSEIEPPRMLTGLDTYGLYATGELKPPEPELDEVNLAVASAVDVLTEMASTGVRPNASREVVTLRHRAVIEAPPDAIYKIVSSPVTWVGVGGSGGQEQISVCFSQSRHIYAQCTMLDDRRDHVSFTWAWLTPCLPSDRELNLKERLDAIFNGELFPDPPLVIDVRLSRGRAPTEVEVTITGVPAEFAEVTDAVWAWGMMRLSRRATKEPALMFPWGNFY